LGWDVALGISTCNWDVEVQLVPRGFAWESIRTENLKLSQNHLVVEVLSNEDGHTACHIGDTADRPRRRILIPRIQ